MSHQDRREPLSAEYQYPTHGVDCDCPPCRNRAYNLSVIHALTVNIMNDWLDGPDAPKFGTPTAYGWGV